VEFPKLVQKKHLELMLKDYVECYLVRVDCIGNSSFKKVAGVLSRQNQKANQAVDYPSEMLLYENVDLIRRVVQTSEKTDNLVELVNTIEAFVKSSFKQRIMNCDVTRPDFLLEGTALSCNDCDVCALLHRVIQYFKENVDPDHHQSLEDCKTKIGVYQGHHVCVVNQQKL